MPSSKFWYALLSHVTHLFKEVLLPAWKGAIGRLLPISTMAASPELPQCRHSPKTTLGQPPLCRSLPSPMPRRWYHPLHHPILPMQQAPQLTGHKSPNYTHPSDPWCNHDATTEIVSISVAPSLPSYAHSISVRLIFVDAGVSDYLPEPPIWLSSMSYESTTSFTICCFHVCTPSSTSSSAYMGQTLRNRFANGSHEE
jgi:hypothetical protein